MGVPEVDLAAVANAEAESPPVCRVAEVVRPAAGGIRRHVSDLLEHLNRRRFSPRLFAPETFVPDRSIPDLDHSAIAIGATTRPFADYEAVGALASLLRDKSDIVHAHGLRGAIVGGFAARRAGLPYLFTVHNLLPKLNFIQATVFLELAKKAARVIAVSEAVAHTVQQTGVAAHRIAIVPNGVDLSRFDPPADTEGFRQAYGIADAERIVLGVGRLALEKGFDNLIEAFALLRTRLPETRLILAGEGPETARLKLQAQPLGDRVLFLGHRLDTPLLLAAADLVAVPSRQEGQGIVPLEAMAAGRAVVASRVGGLVETVVEDRTGLLVPPDAPSALADALEALLTDPNRRLALGAAGRERVQQEYALKTQIQKIEAIYSDVFRRTA
jgi:glycosyltransferase involved in cell wall biosynthesis